VLSGCGHDYTDIASTASRDTSPSAADVPELTADGASFAFDLYRAEIGSDTSSNVFYSPYSISVALAMTYAGAGGDTATQIATAMHFTLPAARLHTAFDALDLALASRQGIKLSVANSIWGQKSLQYGAPFLDTLAVDYGSEVRGVDFINAATQAENDINGWVADQTGGKIESLFGPGALDTSTRVVLVNAVYFDAAWKTQFDTNRTNAATFTKLDGSSVAAMTMNASSLTLNVAQAPTYTAVELPYTGDQTTMLIVMPTGGQFASVAAGLSGQFLSSVVASLQSEADLSLSLPRFTIQGASVSLKSALTTLGMVDAFTSAADLSPMVTDEPLYVHDVVHQAYVRVSESGTEAAAATGVSTAGFAAGDSVAVDHPFFFFIRDVPTGAVLFVGRVMDPTL
jgi:serpin B